MLSIHVRNTSGSLEDKEILQTAGRKFSWTDFMLELYIVQYLKMWLQAVTSTCKIIYHTYKSAASFS